MTLHSIPLNVMALTGVQWSIIAAPEVDASNGDGLDWSTLQRYAPDTFPLINKDTDPP